VAGENRAGESGGGLMRCHVCGCTYERGCPAGCEWVHRGKEPPLCSVCAEMGARLAMYIDDANRVSNASLGRLADLAAAGTGGVGRFIDAKLKARRAGA
jgi:hypothetical protein